MLKRVLPLLIVVTLCLVACQPVALVSEMDETMEVHNGNIVLGIISAPAVASGIVGDQPTGINILLDAPTTEDHYYSDPAHFGHQIPAGGWMEIEVGGSFIRNGVDNDAEYVQINANENLILLAGNPQNAIVQAAGSGPQHGNYSIEDDGERTFTIRPNGGDGANGLEGERAKEIGVKVIHILSSGLSSTTGPASFQNGPAGSEGTVSVRIYDGDGAVLESGNASVLFQESVGPQVFPINYGLATPMQFSPEVETELVEATNFQRVAPGTQLVNTVREGTFASGMPYAPRFLLMDAIENQPDPFGPMVGLPDVGIVIDDATPSSGMLVQDANGDGTLDDSDTVIGEVTITGPSEGSAGHLLVPEDWPLTVTGDGVEGPPGSFFNVPVEVGNESGIYEVTVSLDGGGEATVFLVVEE